MTLSGFSFVRNGTKYDYPFVESIQSILPVCDEFVVAVGNSEDDTLDSLRALNDSRIKIIETVWDETLRTGGRILAQQTDIALSHTTGDWAFYLQADEVVHENDLPVIRNAIRQFDGSSEVEGFLFPYTHFYGSYRYVGSSRRWYRNEIRLVRNRIGVQSWGDAQGFRIQGRKMRVKPLNARIYHYGWVKPPKVQQLKQRTFNRWWHSDGWIREHVREAEEYDYEAGGRLLPFSGSHPQVMMKRVAEEDWEFRYDEDIVKTPIKERILDAVERATGYRIAEYKNYTLV